MKDFKKLSGFDWWCQAKSLWHLSLNCGHDDTVNKYSTVVLVSHNTETKSSKQKRQKVLKREIWPTSRIDVDMQTVNPAGLWGMSECDLKPICVCGDTFTPHAKITTLHLLYHYTHKHTSVSQNNLFFLSERPNTITCTFFLFK